jgi:aminopeptidase
MLTSPFTPDELARYAEVAIGHCLDLRPGELVVLNHEPEHRPLAVALAQAAFRRGLRVDAQVQDPLLVRAELDLADEAVLGAVAPWRLARSLARTEGDAAAVLVDGEGDPNALDGCDPGRITLRARRYGDALGELYQRIGANRDASLILAYPTAAWARRVYPELPADEAQRALAVDVLDFARIGPEDGPGDEALRCHLAMLEERAAVANGLALRALRFRGPGTDLRVRLTEDAVWGHARETNAFGRTTVANLPTEEIYTSPAASATEGTMRCTMPLIQDRRPYEELRAEFRGGRLVRLDARTDEQRDELLSRLDVDEGGRRLGEVALVDSASRIGRRGRMYWNVLLDENQACHVALGLGLGWCRRDGDRTEDLNVSRVHIDVVIGSPDVEVTGTTASGATVALITDGTWRPS